MACSSNNHFSLVVHSRVGCDFCNAVCTLNMLFCSFNKDSQTNKTLKSAALERKPKNMGETFSSHLWH